MFEANFYVPEEWLADRITTLREGEVTEKLSASR